MPRPLSVLPLLLGAAIAHAQDVAAQGGAAAPTPAARTVVLKGRVVGFEGQPLAGVAITFAPPSKPTTAEVLKDPQTRTDAEGRFRLEVETPRKEDLERATLLVAAKDFAALAVAPSWKTKAPAAVAGADEPDVELVDAVDAVDAADADGADGDGKGEPAPEPPPKPRETEYEPETDLGEIVLTEGKRLFGRIRDANGKPLAGVRVTARDVFETGRRFRGGTRHGFHCAVLSDASGIFDLPGALALGARLDFVLDGHYRVTLAPVAASTPLEVTLEKSGFVAGRVLDKDGKSVPEASVTIAYERTNEQPAVRTGEDGSFRLSLAQRGRWRVSAARTPPDGKPLRGTTDVFAGPRENLELHVEPTGAAAADATDLLPVRAIDKKSGKRIVNFRAAALWEDYANQNANYFEYRIQHQMRQERRAGRTAQIAGPGEHNARIGGVRVVAKGYAPGTKKDVEWKELEAGKKRDAIAVELVPESAIEGKVVDEKTGAPVAGAKVWARLRQDPNLGVYDDGQRGPPAEAVVTAADGTFALRGLGEGTWLVRALEPKRPPLPAEEVVLAESETKKDVVLKLPQGARVAGKLVGMNVGRGSRVFLHELPRQTFGDGNTWYSRSYGSQRQPSEGIVDVESDGTFAIDGVKLESFLLVLMMPSPPRHGGHLYVPLEPFRVRRDGIQRDFDCSEDRPGSIRGKVAFPDAGVPLDRIVAVARTVNEEQQQFFSPFETDIPGPRSFVTPAGEFTIRVGPGTYRVDLVDLATGIKIGSTEKNLRVEANGDVACELAAKLKKVTIKVEKEAEAAEMAVVDRFELRFVPKAQKQAGAMFGGNDNHDFGLGVDLTHGTTEVAVALPEGDLTVFARNNVGAIRTDNERHNQGPLGRAELEVVVAPDSKSECVVKVGAPPEIPDPKKDKEKEGAEGKDDGTDGAGR